MGGVASVCRPASWAGPNPSRNPVNCLSEASFTPGNINLKIHNRNDKKEWHISKEACQLKKRSGSFKKKRVQGQEEKRERRRTTRSDSYAPGLGSSASGSRLGCRVKRALNSMASPVSTLLWTGSRTTFFFFSSSGRTQRTERRRNVEHEQEFSDSCSC